MLYIEAVGHSLYINVLWWRKKRADGCLDLLSAQIWLILSSRHRGLAFDSQAYLLGVLSQLWVFLGRALRLVYWLGYGAVGVLRRDILRVINC